MDTQKRELRLARARMWAKRYRAENRLAHLLYQDLCRLQPGYYEQMRRYQYKWRYGITVADYEQRLREQAGVCAFCKRPPKRLRLAVDHDHTTGKVRGLLCYTCNRFKVATHTLETAKRLVEYLSKV